MVHLDSGAEGEKKGETRKSHRRNPILRERKRRKEKLRRLLQAKRKKEEGNQPRKCGSKPPTKINYKALN